MFCYDCLTGTCAHEGTDGHYERALTQCEGTAKCLSCVNPAMAAEAEHRRQEMLAASKAASENREAA